VRGRFRTAHDLRRIFCVPCKPWRKGGRVGLATYGTAMKPGQIVGIKQTDERIWLVGFMDYDLGYFDDET
jgi:hypothetical protein